MSNTSKLDYVVDAVNYVISNQSKYLPELDNLRKNNKNLTEINQQLQEGIKLLTSKIEEYQKLLEDYKIQLSDAIRTNNELQREVDYLSKLEVSQASMTNNLLFLLGETYGKEDEISREVQALGRALVANGLSICYDYNNSPSAFLQIEDDNVTQITLSCPALFRDDNVVISGEIFVPHKDNKEEN